jgi:hypothetical protein
LADLAADAQGIVEFVRLFGSVVSQPPLVITPSLLRAVFLFYFFLNLRFAVYSGGLYHGTRVLSQDIGHCCAYSRGVASFFAYRRHGAQGFPQIDCRVWFVCLFVCL